MQITINQAQQDCDAKILYNGDTSSLFFDGAAFDNRLVKEGNLFVCIKGENNDGHNFAEDAVKRGAKAILAEHNPFKDQLPVPVLLVENSVQALGKIAHAARIRFGENKDHKVIGITGTAGKTSLKELISHILCIEKDLSFNETKVAKNILNYNTQIGMPISILNATGKEKYWVLELGISHPQDMHELGLILVPDMAIILNAASGHTEGLGDKGVAFYKSQILNFLPQDGVGFVSADYPELFVHSAFNRPDTRFFSTSAKLPYRAKFKEINLEGFGIYDIVTPQHHFEVESVFIGNYGAENCIAACAIALELGFTEQQIQQGIKTALPPQMRFNKYEKENWTIIDDTYNANPLSTARMIESAVALATNKDFIMVLGEMKELGDLAISEHQEIGTLLGSSNPLAIYYIGNLAEAVEEGLKKTSYKGIFKSITQKQELLDSINSLSFKHEKHVILFKGSRSNHLEEYFNTFMEQNHAL